MMARDPSSASEWTSAVETMVEAEILRRRRVLHGAIALSLLVGALAIVLATKLRGVSWSDLDAQFSTRLAPLVSAQNQQAARQQALQAEITRLEAEIRRLDAEVQASLQPDPAVAALQRRVRRLERANHAAAEDRQRLDFRLDNWYAEQAAARR